MALPSFKDHFARVFARPKNFGVHYLAAPALAFALLSLHYSRSQSAPDNGMRLFSWGSGIHGQLGLGSEVLGVGVPSEIVDLSDKNVIYISTVGDISAALTDEGELYTWGKTKGGAQGGTGGRTFTTNLTQPTLVEIGEGLRFKDVAVGRSHVAAVTKEGQLWTWGNPAMGKLGHEKEVESTAQRSYRPKNYADHAELDQVRGALEAQRVKQIVCGFHHTVCLTEDGSVYTFGQGKEGALGHGSWDQQGAPKRVESLPSIVKVDSGADFTMCLDGEGRVFSFGKNSYGQLGLTGANTYKMNTPQ